MIRAASVSSGVVLFDHHEAVERKEVAREFRGAGAVVAPEQVVGTDAGYALQKIRERRELRIARAAFVERAIAQEGKLAAMKAEFIDLRVIQLDNSHELRRGEFAPSTRRKRR